VHGRERGERRSRGYRSPGAPIVIPRDSPGPVEFEGELVAVVATRARNLSEDEALGCLLGLTLGNDVSERRWQRSDRTLWRAKNTDMFKPMGPVIATGLDPMRRHISVRRHRGGGPGDRRAPQSDHGRVGQEDPVCRSFPFRRSARRVCRCPTR
jgi:hypothetical protein